MVFLKKLFWGKMLNSKEMLHEKSFCASRSPMLHKLVGPKNQKCRLKFLEKNYKNTLILGFVFQTFILKDKKAK